MRARARAVAAAASAALIVVPLTGAAAAALVTAPPVTPDAANVMAANIDHAQDVADAPTQISADADAELAVDTPTIKVKKNPVIVHASTRTSGGTAVGNSRPVEASASVKQAIAGSKVIAYASNFVGVPYVHGGSSPSGFDCSGFVSYVYAHFGISLPHQSSAYWGIGTRVSSPKPGDIIVTSGHVALYAGSNLQIDAPVPGKTIQFRAIWQNDPTYIRVTD
jgi:cell wall-associated NlpC family hydrolase